MKQRFVYTTPTGEWTIWAHESMITGTRVEVVYEPTATSFEVEPRRPDWWTWPDGVAKAQMPKKVRDKAEREVQRV